MRTRRVDCTGPGIRRIRRGRGFSYEIEGRPVAAEDRARIDALAIPPAWRDVWICSDDAGHIQATGIDDAGRKQYLYHDAWRLRRDQQKFDEMLDFGAALPTLRRRVSRDLGGKELSRERVLAAAVRLLDQGFFRIGSERYADQNETYGLATLRRRHVRFEKKIAIFDYKAKGSLRHVRELSDGDAIAVLRALKRRKGGGEELLAFRDGKQWRDVRSSDINDYLKAASGGDFSAKDFRTWNATVLAAVRLAVAAEGDDPAATKTARKRIVNSAVKEVAAYLSNTPAVCRRSYIDPRVIERFESGSTISLDGVSAEAEPTSQRRRGAIERRVLELLT
jgi:DNA topoisomerase IB